MGFQSSLSRTVKISPESSVAQRPQSQLGTRSSEYTPLVSQRQRRKSDGGATLDIPVLNFHETQEKHVKLSSYRVDPTAAYESELSREFAVYASAKLASGISEESSDARTLKSVVGALSTILQYYGQATAKHKTIKALLPRIEGLAYSLSTPVPEGEVREIERRQALIRKLEEVLQVLNPLAERGKITRFLDNVRDGEILRGLAEDIRDAMTEYQTALQQDIYKRRFQLIDKVELSLLEAMQHTADAGFSAGGRNECLLGTRGDVLLRIEEWLVDERDHRIFWLNGLAGTGKSTIAQTFAKSSSAYGKLGASFFCSRDSADRNNLQAIFPTLAFQLAHHYPQFREELFQVLRADRGVERGALISQLTKLIVRPLKATKIPTLIIIDALDECKDRQSVSALLSMLSRQVHEIPQVKFFITSRAEPPIQGGFRLELLRPLTGVLKLHEVPRSTVDIQLYLRTELANIPKTRKDLEFPEEWPSSYDIKILCEKAAGLFIYASTVIKFVASEFDLPTERLGLILGSQNTEHEEGIDILYAQILELAFRDAGSSKKELYSRFRTIVGAVLLVFHPLSRKALSDLVRACKTPAHISITLNRIRSLLDVPDSENDPILVFQQSFQDFLTDRTRCTDERFFVDPPVHHEGILFSCLDLMKARLKKNICHLEDYAILSQVKDLSARRETYIGSSLEYACRFWTRHLASIPGNGPQVERVQKAIDEFFKKHLLSWIEVLSIVGYIGVAVYAVNDIRRWYISAGVSTSEQADDCERLILEYFDAIRDSPSQIYHSALPLSPSSSWVRKCHNTEVSGEVRVLMGLPDRWGACSRTIPLEGRPTSLAYQGNMIAVGLESDVVFLDAITGTMLSVLSGHGGVVSSIAFSQDGRFLVSGGKDRTVKLWNVKTGEVIETFRASSISSVSIAPNGTTVASGTWDGSIYLWEVLTGSFHSIDTRQTDVSIVSFSPTDSRRLISSSLEGTVQQWDVDGHQIENSYHEADRVDDLTYTTDGTRSVSCGGKVATIRDFVSGAVIAKLDAPDRTSLYRCCFSPDGRLVASAADTIIYVWDITTSEPRLVGRLVGHTDTITFLTFSSSLISGSRDQSIKFWQSNSFLSDSTTIDDTGGLHGSTPIASVNLFPGDGTVVNSDDSGVVNTWDLMTGRRKTSSSTPAKGIRDTHLVGDTLVVVWWVDDEKQYHVWDVGRGQLLRKVYSLLSGVKDLKVSGDGTKIFGLGDGRIEVRCTQTGKYMGGAWLEGGIGSVLIVHGSKVEYDGKKGWGWDFGGQKVSEFGELPDRPRLDVVDWSDGRRVKPCWIEDTVTMRRIFRLPERYMGSDTQVGWDGRYLLVWSRSGEVLVMDFDSVCPR